jgi:V/A-type H+-transporting ATPase subunit C
MIRLSENPEYGFAVGRVRALEPALMDRSRYERLVRARGSVEFVAALTETAYTKFLDGSSANVSHAFDKASEENAAFFSQYAQEGWLLHLFRLPAALRSLKAAIKDALSRGKSEVPTPAEFIAMQQHAVVSSAVAAAVQAFERDRDPAAVDMVVDRLLQDLRLRTADTSEFILGYLGLHADLENLRTLVRLKAQPGGGEDQRGGMETAFLGGGGLELRDLVATIEEPWAAVVERFAKAPPGGCGNEAFRDYLEQGTAAVADRRSLVRMERLGRETELRYLRQTRYATFGYEPLVTFFLLRENELRNLRQLYAAKLAGLADEEARDLVAYVE